MRIVVVSGGTSEPSSTRALADRVVGSTRKRAARQGLGVEVQVVELRPLASAIAAAFTAGFAGDALEPAVSALAAADALVVATPVYRAGISGLVKSFLDVVDQDLLIAVPTVPVATAGTARHALVADEDLRSLLAYFRTLTTPTSVFAAAEDWGTKALGDRIERAANELVVLAAAGVRDAMRDDGTRYTRVFGSAASRGAEIDLDTDLMRLATGGAARSDGRTDGAPAEDA